MFSSDLVEVPISYCTLIKAKFEKFEVFGCGFCCEFFIFVLYNPVWSVDWYMRIDSKDTFNMVLISKCQSRNIDHEKQ